MERAMIFFSDFRMIASSDSNPKVLCGHGQSEGAAIAVTKRRLSVPEPSLSRLDFFS
jgi:hypothetical protein